MDSLQPDLTGRTEVIRKSELLGFPPVACLASQTQSSEVQLIRKALLVMQDDEEGREVLSLLRLDGFAEEPNGLYDSIAEKVRLVRSIGP
jgi:phosphonate transport system substrate-binding protein